MPENRRLVKTVEKALAENEETADLKQLHITAVADVVFLDGEVSSAAEADLVAQAVKKVEGVRMVRNRLQINPQARGGGWQQPHQHDA